MFEGEGARGAQQIASATEIELNDATFSILAKLVMQMSVCLAQGDPQENLIGNYSLVRDFVGFKSHYVKY